MTNDEILQAAKEAGIPCEIGRPYEHKRTEFQRIERFAAIIEKRTIERCAAYITSGRYMILNPSETYTAAQHIMAIKAHDKHQATAIRKLGEQR